MISEIEQLRKENEKLRAILSKIPGNLYWKGINGIYEGCNEHLANIHHFTSPDEIIGQTDYDMLSSKQAEKIQATDRSIMESGTEFHVEEEGFNIDGSPAVYLTSKTPIRDSKNNIIGLLGISLDITERKRLEKELNESQAREAAEKARVTAAQATAASIAHDMRTPLAGIQMAAGGIKKFLPRLVEAYKMARDADLDVPLVRQEHLSLLEDVAARVQQQAAFALALITSTLQSAKPTGLETDKFENFNMIECVKKALDMYSYKSKEQDKIHFNAENNFIFWGGETEMLNLLFNLMKNAYHFIAKVGYGDITIWLENKDDHNELHFKDTGPGIPEEVLPTLFQPFVTHREGGTGLGLNFCRKAMAAFKGSITCQSEEGEYTEFTMVFPKVAEEM